MSDVITFAFMAALNPTLVTATTVMLLLERPARLMLGYLLGAYVTSITLGVLIVHALHGRGTTNTTQHTISPAVDIVLGLMALTGAYVLATGRAARARERRRTKKLAKNPTPLPPRWQREMNKGSPRVTFVVGALLTLPGASYIAALNAIHKLDPATPGDLALVVLVNVIMLLLLELPLLSFAVAPAWTPKAIERVKGYAQAHGLRLAARGLAIVGALLVIKGVIGAIA